MWFLSTNAKKLQKYDLVNEKKKANVRFCFSSSVLRIHTESSAERELEMWGKGPKHREINATGMLQ